MGLILENAIIFDEEDSVARNNKEQEYLEYIKEHIYLVCMAYKKYFFPYLQDDTLTINCPYVSDNEMRYYINQCGLHISNHDASKFSDDEFDGYRVKYFPTLKEENLDDEKQKEIDARVDECWEHHYKNNPHHPKYWVDSETGAPTDMKLDAIIEMICDWCAMSEKFHNDVREWYEKDAVEEKKAMTDNTKQMVEFILNNIINK